MINDEDFVCRAIDSLKRKLISRHVYLMLFVLVVYTLFFYFVLNTPLLAGCTLIGFVLFLYTWLLIRKNYQIKTVVHVYLIFAPLFTAFTMLFFWKQFVSGCIWLLPIPLGAYIFFQKKYMYWYTLYIIVIIFIVNLVNNFFSFPSVGIENKILSRVSDTFVYIVNVAIFSLLLYYKDKIRRLEIEKRLIDNGMNTFEKKNTTLSVNADRNESIENIEKYTELFNKIKVVIEDESRFKESDFTVSNLCSILKTNNIYISKAIKLNGYSTFNHYINTCRVNNVKVLINESDLSKVTLMYAYTASGFSNQSTFNRVFKQIEGITPSEYIKQL